MLFSGFRAIIHDNWIHQAYTFRLLDVKTDVSMTKQV